MVPPTVVGVKSVPNVIPQVPPLSPVFAFFCGIFSHPPPPPPPPPLYVIFSLLLRKEDILLLPRERKRCNLFPWDTPTSFRYRKQTLTKPNYLPLCFFFLRSSVTFTSLLKIILHALLMNAFIFFLLFFPPRGSLIPPLPSQGIFCAYSGKASSQTPLSPLFLYISSILFLQIPFWFPSFLSVEIWSLMN